MNYSKAPKVKVHYSDYEKFEADVESIHYNSAKCGGTEVMINRKQVPQLIESKVPFAIRIPKEAEFIA